MTSGKAVADGDGDTRLVRRAGEDLTPQEAFETASPPRVGWGELAARRTLRCVALRGALAALVLLGMLAPTPPRATAQGNGLPTEPTLSALRQEILRLAEQERQLQLTGQGDPAALSALEEQALAQDFEDNVAPSLKQASQDCFFAEVPLGKALVWARQVQLLGVAEEGGGLEAQYARFSDLLHTTLVTCDEQLYKRCVLDDDDPNAAELGTLMRTLSLLGDEDLTYQKRYFDCAYGWRGTVTLKETLQASWQRVERLGNATETTTRELSGTRELTIERVSKQEGGTGSATGRNESKQTGLYDSGPPTPAVQVQCRATKVFDSIITSSGSGDAVWLKHGTAEGPLQLSLHGPIEQGAERLSTDITVSGTNSSCPRSSQSQSQNGLGGGSWEGAVTATLDDPFAETLSGSTTLYFVINAGGVAVAARPDASGGFARIPAQPGALVEQASRPLVPWLHPGSTVSVSDWQGDPPVIKVEVSWNLQFGQP